MGKIIQYARNVTQLTTRLINATQECFVNTAKYWDITLTAVGKSTPIYAKEQVDMAGTEDAVAAQQVQVVVEQMTGADTSAKHHRPTTTTSTQKKGKGNNHHNCLQPTTLKGQNGVRSTDQVRLFHVEILKISIDF